ncbi:atlastin-2-like isoform X2 [Clavelina lepadiformis]|uniref:atlastin-2-like isoform X2 n=1 Tax=Clavelina lepadiformis TaxID=159417 RepID=UPI004040EFD4
MSKTNNQNGANLVEEPRALQIISPKEGEDGYHINEAALCKIFNHPDVIHTPVMIVSIAGAMREGKSFLLSLLILYLESGMSPDWTTKGDQPLKRHFRWTTGFDRETLGIYMWSKPYVVSKSDKSKVAILLMDTQGAFDKQGKTRSSDIIAFSTLLSSIQIYNIQNQVNENDLEPLSVFTGCAAELVKSNVSNAGKSQPPFQTIMFVIRDWQVSSKLKAGLKGGSDYIKKEVFHVKKSDKVDVISVRHNIKQAFEKIRCCLFPSPGTIICGHVCDSPEMNATMKDISPSFKTTLAEFAYALFKPEDSAIKMVNGQKLTGRKLFNFLSQYHRLFCVGNFSKPVTILEANAVADAQNVLQVLLASYNKLMTTNLSRKDYLPKIALNNLHTETKIAMISKYDLQFKTPFEKVRDQYRDQLESEIENAYSSHAQSRIRKEAHLRKQYMSFVRKTTKRFKENAAKTLSTKKRSESVEEAEKYFDDFAPKSPLVDEYKQQLIKEIEDCLLAQLSLEESLKEILNSAVGMYMSLTLEKMKTKSSSDLDSIHHRCQNLVTTTFKEELKNLKTRSGECSLTDDQLLSHFEKEFNEMKAQYKADTQTEFHSKYRAHCEEVKDQYLKFMWKATDNVYATPPVLRSIHDKFKKLLQAHHKSFVNTAKDKILAEEELNALEEKYIKIAADIQKRKNAFREASHIVLVTADESLATLTFPCGGWIQNTENEIK